MKIALIDPSLFTFPYDKALADALIGQGHQVTLYTKHLGVKEQGKGAVFLQELFYPGFQAEFMKSLPKPVFLGLKGIAHFFSLIHLWLVLRNEKPDVIHFQWVPLPVVDRMFVPLFRKIAPAILTVHDSSPFNDNPRSRLQAMGAIDIMRDYDHLIVHTEKAKESIRKYGIADQYVSRIDHGVIGIDNFPDIPENAANDSAPVTILLFGHLKPYKGADLLIEALAKMPESTLRKTRLRIVGKPQMDTEPLFAMARQLKVENNIQWDLRFIGDDEIGQVFAESDITAMPYREIDASGVLMVSLSVGRPIVATKIGLFAEILEDGTHGYLVPMEDPAALAAALTKLVENPAQRKAMASNVRALSQSIPSWRDISQKTVNLYEDMIARAG